MKNRAIKNIVLFLAIAAGLCIGAGTAWSVTMNCFECHAGGGPNNPHHVTDEAAAGNCEHCHADPRPDPSWTGAFPADNGYNSCSDVPTQLACRGCHVRFVGGNMEVTRFTRTNYVDYSGDYTRTVVHTLPSPRGQINNYGICLGCHTTNDNPALNITVFHARPDKHSSAWVIGQADGERCTGYKEVWDDNSPVPLKYALHAPGRSSSGIGSFNLYKDPGFGYTPDRRWDNDICSDEAQYASSPLNFVLLHVPAQLAGGAVNGADVPVFASLQRETADGTIPACSASATITKTFTYTGAVQTFILPPNAMNIQFTLKSAGGGGGRDDWEHNQTAGQPGSMVTAKYPNTVTTGTVLKIYVAGGGKMGSTTSTGAAGGFGNPYGQKGHDGEDWGPGEWAFGGAGGGGASSIFNGSTKLAMARGGNGGRSSDWNYDEYDWMIYGGSGGAGGGSNYYPNGTYSATGGGAGGSTAPTNGGNGQIIITYEVP